MTAKYDPKLDGQANAVLMEARFSTLDQWSDKEFLEEGLQVICVEYEGQGAAYEGGEYSNRWKKNFHGHEVKHAERRFRKLGPGRVYLDELTVSWDEFTADMRKEYPLYRIWLKTIRIRHTETGDILTIYARGHLNQKSQTRNAYLLEKNGKWLKNEDINKVMRVVGNLSIQPCHYDHVKQPVDRFCSVANKPKKEV